MASDALPTPTPPTDSTSKTAGAIVAVLMLASLAIRYHAATTVPMPYDEAILVGMTDNISLRPGAMSLPVHGHRHPAGQLYLAKFGTALLGRSIIGFRLMSVALGTASCWLIFALVRGAWGVWPGVFSLFLLCFNGFHVGVSRFAMERTYLFFTILAIYLFWRAVSEDRPRLLIAAGGVIGAGALVSEHTLLLLPIFAVYLVLSRARRAWLARWQSYAGVALALLVLAPVMYLYLTTPPPEGVAQGDMEDHAERLGRLGFSYGPLSLYIPPLYYMRSDRISVYPVMSLVGGSLLLIAVLRAHVRSGDELTKLLLVLFWLIAGGFSLFASDRPEFKWAALSLFAAIPLAGRLLWELWQRRPALGVLMCVPLAYIAGFGIWVANASYNCYYSPLIRPDQQRITDQVVKHSLFIALWYRRDFSALCDSPLYRARYADYYFERYIRFSYDMLRKRKLALARLFLNRASYLRPEHTYVTKVTVMLERAEADAEAAGPGAEELGGLDPEPPW